MEPLKQTPTAPPRCGRRAGLLVLLGLALCACQWFGVLTESGGPTFPHPTHVDELDCTACHDGAEDRADAGFPASEKGCMLCHEEIDANKPFGKTVAAFLVDGKPSWSVHAKHYDGDVRFDHSAHFEAELDCEACHDPVLKGTGVGLRISGGKSKCQECHAKTTKGNDCAVCHKVLRADQRPPDHGANWKRVHGVHARTMIKGTGRTTCAQCHEESSCSACHQREPPASHKNVWRHRGHGLAASINRSSCVTCHQPDYCASCHRSTQPRSHRGSFGPPRNRHCETCHVSPRGQGCTVCHKNAPTHSQAQPLPGDVTHRTARSPIDCMTCHVALKHFNPGLDCRLCHK